MFKPARLFVSRGLLTISEWGK